MTSLSKSPITARKPADKKKAQGIYRKLAESYGDASPLKRRRSEVLERSRKKLR